MLALSIVLAGCSSSSGADEADAGAPPGSDACAYPPVTLPFSFDEGTSGDTTYYSFAPHGAFGVVVELHGTGGTSLSIAEKRIEWASFNAEAVARGYALLIPESEERGHDAQWSNATKDNPDLDRISSLLADMQAEGAISSTTPVFFMGMSQGGGVAPIFAGLFAAHGAPVRGVALYCSGGSKVLASAEYQLPTIFNLMQADQIVTNADVESSYEALAARGIDAEIFTKPVEKVCSTRFTRIPGISASDSIAITTGLVGGGSLLADGTVEIAADDLESPTSVSGLPPEYAAFSDEIVEQLSVVSAQHQFYGDRDAATLDFFDAHR